MADIVITIAAALALGLIAHELRIPPLVGFLAAGFLLHVFGFTAFAGLQQVSDVGVVLLLFTIGLKFDLRSLLQPEAHGTAALHMVTVVLLGAGTIGAPRWPTPTASRSSRSSTRSCRMRTRAGCG